MVLSLQTLINIVSALRQSTTGQRYTNQMVLHFNTYTYSYMFVMQTDSIYDTFNAWNGSGGFLQQVHRGRVVTEILSELEVEQLQVRLGLMGELTADM